MAAGLVCLALAAAPAAGAGSTARGTILSEASQVVSQSNGDGTVTTCEVLGGTLRTASGQNVNFAAGGVLTGGRLDAQAQAIASTIEAGARQGTTVIVTLGYVDSQPLCGYALANFVDERLARGRAGADTDAAPTPSATGPSGPAPTTHTASGTIAAMSPGIAILTLPPDHCEAWRGAMRTDAGKTIDFFVETALTGDLRTTGLHPVDKTAFQRARALLQACGLVQPPTTITYRGPVTACGYDLAAVVTAVKVKLPRHRRTGRITRLSSTRVRSGGCKLWTGALRTCLGQKVRFAVQSPGVAKTLRRARERRAVTTVTYVIDQGVPCNPRSTLIVVRARIARSRSGSSGR